MKKLKIITIIFLLVVSISSATTYNFINLEDEEECMEKISYFPEKYFDGVASILIQEPPEESGPWFRHIDINNNWYFWGSYRIKMYSGCYMDNLAHELAHHKNKMDNYTFRESLKHGDIFNIAYEEIRMGYRR